MIENGTITLTADELAYIAPYDEALEQIRQYRADTAGFPITERCACGPQGDRVQFHKLYGPGCRWTHVAGYRPAGAA